MRATRVFFAGNMREGAGKRETNIYYLYYKYVLSRLCNLKRCSKWEFAVLTLITGSSKAFVEMAITEG